MIRFFVFSALISCALGASVQIHWSDDRIVGGEETTIEEFPYQISLEHYGRHICGGSIIGKKAVLTAAHCVDEASSFAYKVRVGSSKIIHGGNLLSVSRIIAHPKYDPSNSDYDMAIILLNDPIPLSESAQIIPLTSEEALEGTTATVTGWGTLYSNGPLATKLFKVDIPIITREKCQKRYPREKISPRMICAGFDIGGKDSCQGDSGGPLVANGKQIGVVSWGYGCAAPKKPGVYANVAELRSWIEQTINTE